MAPVMDRREAIRCITTALGGVLSTPTLSGLLAGCEAAQIGAEYVSRTLSAEQLRQIEAIAELIIPETDTPGATAARVHVFVDMMLTDFYAEPERVHFLTELGRVDSVASRLFGKGFGAATREERGAVLEAFDVEAYPDPERDADLAAAVEARVAGGTPPFMRTMKELTVAGYYTSEIGQTVELRTMPFGPCEADVPFDQIGRTWE